MASELGGISRLPQPPLQCLCWAWMVLLWEKRFLFPPLICKLFNACHCYFSQQLLLLKLSDICFGFLTLARVGHSNVEPVVSHLCAAQSGCREWKFRFW